ncbi:hypothetical protein [Pedobacter punctiformis]|uniref:Uncharacterized protein n=1 Tax=Pedobacter punctiformis TaxID=3004097 RepID=A0ABT4LCD1_9SPHI|nr:hypothetical protein [Pedobacter sp. HCMS5-2]MCZ4244454.1 hypothetical protein [Pedobacter sp. HCMS5-2]
MKKFFKITAAILVLLLIFFVGTFKYRQYKANRMLIPANATALVKINTDQIYKSIGLNMISNLGYYLKSGEKKNTKTTATKFDTGLDIPAAICFYTVEGKSDHLFFTRLSIKDSVAFKNFITKTLNLKPAKNFKNETYFAMSADKRLTILYHKTAVAIACSSGIEDSEQTLINILDQKNFVKISESNFKDLNKYSDHILFTDQKNIAKLNFNSGNIDFSNEFTSNLQIPAKTVEHRVFNPENTMNLWLNAKLGKGENKSLKLKDLNLERDSIAKYYNGYLDVEWTNSTSQIDSVITYDYNDDFEKVEKVTLQKHDVPNLSINVAANANGLKNYLQQQNFIIADSNVVNKSIFPLYKLFVSNGPQNLFFSTSKRTKLDLKQEKTTDFFYLNINFNKVNKQISLPFITNFAKSLNKLEAKGKSIGHNKVRIDGKLEFNNKDINALYQLLKSF